MVSRSNKNENKKQKTDDKYNERKKRIQCYHFFLKVFRLNSYANEFSQTTVLYARKIDEKYAAILCSALVQIVKSH